MAVVKRKIKDSLKGKTLDYVNDFFIFKHTPEVLTDSFSFNTYKVLVNLSDVDTNNYSNLFLTKRQLNTDWLETQEKTKTLMGAVTTISFVSNNPHDALKPGIWLEFYKPYAVYDSNQSEATYKLTESRPDTNIYNYYFNIEFLNETECRISHNHGDFIYYFSVTNRRTLHFTITYDSTCIFKYKLNDEGLQLFKTLLKYDTDGNIISGATYVLCYKTTDDGYILDLTDDFTTDESNIIYINQPDNNLGIHINNSYIGYDQSRYITAIHEEKSAFDIKSQTLLHHQYSMDGEMNFIPLKSSMTYKDSYGRGDNMTISYDNYPDVYYRSYHGIHSGINQEYGHDNIILNYMFTDQIYTLNDGDVVEFYIPLPEENYDRNPIYPFKKLNIKDSKLVKNGAFASDVPYFSDKVYKLQGENTLIFDKDTGVRLSPNNGVYLCTWLYQTTNTSSPIWFDRYYYPDKVSRAKALTQPHYSESFENVMDLAYNNDNVDTIIRENTYFDKVSDLVFEPGNRYKYARLSSQMINDVIARIADYRVDNVEDQDGGLHYLSELMNLDNKHYIKVDHDKFSKTNIINFNTDIYITNGEKIGIQIFGSDYLAGLNIQNRKDLAPYHYYATQQEIYLLNNQFEIRHSFNLYEKYGDLINKFILGDIFDDVVVISNQYFYIFNYDLSLKSKIYYGDIKGINDITIDGEKGNLFGDIVTDKPVPLEEYKESKISKLLCEENAILYHNNLYVPYNQDVIKIIFCPDMDKDEFPESDMENYPCKIRVMDYDEYYCCYARTTNKGVTVQEPSLKNGYVLVEKRIKNLYFNKEGKLYGFYFDQIAISPDDDTMYGLLAWDKFIYAGGWYWMYNMSLTKLETQADNAKFAEFASEESIDRIKINETGMMCLVRGFDGMTQERRFEIYDRSKRCFYRYSLLEYDEVYSLDTYKYIDMNYEEQSVFTLLAKRGNYLYKIEYQCNSRQVQLTWLENLPLDKNPRFYETTNSNGVIKYGEENKLYFNLFLPNNYLYDYREVIEWDLTDVQTGWYNINIYVNLNEAKYEVRINDILYEDRNDSTQFKPFVNSNGNVFDVTYYIGTVGKRYGTTMSKILSDSGIDPYACKNSKIENAVIYNKALEYHEYQAMRLEGKNINPISITIPCGQRPNIEEIVRYFKYVPPAYISNKVRINITGTGLSTKGEFELLRREIITALQNEKDCLVDINNIEFV